MTRASSGSTPEQAPSSAAEPGYSPAAMGEMNRQILLKQRPEGLVQRDDFEAVEGVVPAPGDGEVLVRTDWLGIDATVRTWLSRAEGYIPPVEIGEVVRCSGIGTVLQSSSPKVPEGSVVTTLTGWQEFAVVSDDL